MITNYLKKLGSKGAASSARMKPDQQGTQKSAKLRPLSCQEQEKVGNRGLCSRIWPSGWKGGHPAPTSILRSTGTGKQRQKRGKRKKTDCRRGLGRVPGKTFASTLPVDANVSRSDGEAGKDALCLSGTVISTNTSSNSHPMNPTKN